MIVAELFYAHKSPILEYKITLSSVFLKTVSQIESDFGCLWLHIYSYDQDTVFAVQKSKNYTFGNQNSLAMAERYNNQSWWRVRHSFEEIHVTFRNPFARFCSNSSQQMELILSA